MELHLEDILVEDTIREEEDVIKDIRDVSALEKSKKTLSALNHCNHFLDGYCKKEGFKFHRIEEIPYDGIDKKGNLFWDKFIASFMHYLASTAYCWFDKEKGLLSWEAAKQYASSIKIYLVTKFKTENQISVFRDEQWKVFMKQLWSIKKAEGRKTGKKLVNGHEGSNDDDRIAIGTACIWIGDSRAAQFFALENAKYFTAGRCREVSLLEVKDISIKKIDENGKNFRILTMKIERDKQGGNQTIHLHPHQEHFQQDIYFALIYNILVTRHIETFVFKQFAERAQRQIQGLTKSSVSQLWSTCFKALFKQFAGLAEEVNINLKSHSGKTGCNQKLAENPLTAGLPQIFHSGWELRGAHSLFDYVVASAVMMKQTAKVLAGWTTVGGEPPSIKDVRGEEDLRLVRILGSHLFMDDYDSRWSPAIRELLIASLLRFYPDLVKILELHPTGKYKNLKTHPFIRSLWEVLEGLKIDQCRFNGWCVDVRKGFLQRNCEALPIQVLTDNGYDGLDEVQVDARSFLTQINTLTRAYMAVSNRMGSIGEDVRRVIDRQDRLEKKLDRVIELVEARSQVEESERLVYSDAIASHNPATPAVLFVRFFQESLHVLYHEQLKTNAWKCLSKQERSKISTHYRRQKKCVRYMLCFTESFPTRPPRPPRTGYCEWFEKLHRDSKIAEKAMLDYWNRTSGKPHSDKLTFSMIDSKVFEDLEDKFNLDGIKGMMVTDFEKLKKS